MQGCCWVGTARTSLQSPSYRLETPHPQPSPQGMELKARAASPSCFPALTGGPAAVTERVPRVAVGGHQQAVGVAQVRAGLAQLGEGEVLVVAHKHGAHARGRARVLDRKSVV